MKIDGVLLIRAGKGNKARALPLNGSARSALADYAAMQLGCAARNLMSADTTPHALRHTFAHRYLDQNPGDLIGLARILGHESLETTKIYLRLTADDLAQRVERMSLNAYG